MSKTRLDQDQLEARVFDLVANPPAPGVTDHGALSGLGDDDHPQYHNDARGDARYQATLVSGANIKTINGSSVLGSGNLSVSSSVAVTQVTLDFGVIPTRSKAFTIAFSGASVGQKVIMVPAADTDDDELEMDMLISAARVSATDTIAAYVHATPSPVKGQRRFNIILG